MLSGAYNKGFLQVMWESFRQICLNVINSPGQSYGSRIHFEVPKYYVFINKQITGGTDWPFLADIIILSIYINNLTFGK